LTENVNFSIGRIDSLLKITKKWILFPAPEEPTSQSLIRTAAIWMIHPKTWTKTGGLVILLKLWTKSISAS